MRVTTGIPFLNAQQTLPDAIRSVFAQEFEDWELILVDDGSTDDSLRIARSVDDPRVKVLSDGTNLGLQRRLNQIAGLARGDYLARMDADDIMHPKRLARQVEYLDTNPCVDVIDSGTFTISPDNQLTGMRPLAPIESTPGAVMKHGMFFHPTVIGRTEWFRQNPYDERFRRAEDFELWCRTCEASRFSRVCEPLLYYRESHKAPRAYAKYYWEDSRYCRRCLLMHGPSSVGWPKTAHLIARSFTKGCIYHAATLLGMQSVLIGMRQGAPLDENDRQSALKGLRTVMATSVPGLNKR